MVKLDAVKLLSCLCPAPRILELDEGSTSIQMALKPRHEQASGSLQGNGEGYRLTIEPDGTTIEARGEAGFFYGEQTLRQIIDALDFLDGALPATIPCLRIEDWPDIANRGYMLDISRCKVPTFETLERIVGLLASLKYNQLQLYTEHTFAFKDHEMVWADASPMTAEAIRHLDRLCAESHIELVPNFNSFGHWERWLKHPEYHQYAECPDGFDHPGIGREPHSTTLRPSDASIELLDSLYAELLPNFTHSEYFNIGCDETWELGMGWSKARAEELGTERVYLNFLLKLHQLVSDNDRKAMFWSDIILKQPDLISEIPEDMTALVWGYDANTPFNERCPLFANADVPYYVAPGTSAWNSLGGRIKNMSANIANAVENATRYDAAGFLLTDWGDGGHHQTYPVSLPGIVTGAAHAWNHEGALTSLHLERILSAHIFHDATGNLARGLLLAGSTPEQFAEVMGNSSAVNHMLFFTRPNWLRDLLTRVTTEEIERCLGVATDARVLIEKAEPLCEDGDLFVRECTLTTEFIRVAAMRGLWGKSSDKRHPADLKVALTRLIHQHESLWLERNCLGGLHESSGRLRAALATLDDPAHC